MLLGFVMYIRPLASSVKQGLDLQGGTHVVLQAVDTPQLKVNDDALDRATHIIERRVNALGLTEPVVQRQGRDRIIVELPGVKDPEKAINMLGKTAMLEFKDPNNKTVLTGTDLKDAKAVVGNGNQPLVSMEFSCGRNGPQRGQADRHHPGRGSADRAGGAGSHYRGPRPDHR